MRLIIERRERGLFAATFRQGEKWSGKGKEKDRDQVISSSKKGDQIQVLSDLRYQLETLILKRAQSKRFSNVYCTRFNGLQAVPTRTLSGFQFFFDQWKNISKCEGDRTWREESDRHLLRTRRKHTPWYFLVSFGAAPKTRIIRGEEEGLVQSGFSKPLKVEEAS